MKTTKTSAGKYSVEYRREIYSIVKIGKEWHVFAGSDSKPCATASTKRDAITQIVG
jgi:hypothetical protein